jgi:hypothetical protein
MSDRAIHRRRAACAGLLGLFAASALLFGTIDVAKADTPEYWMRETFRTERPTVTASLSSDDDDEDAKPARRRAPRASITHSHRERHVRTHRHSKKAHHQKKHVRVASLGNTHTLPE